MVPTFIFSPWYLGMHIYLFKPPIYIWNEVSIITTNIVLIEIEDDSFKLLFIALRIEGSVTLIVICALHRHLSEFVTSDIYESGWTVII